MDHRGKEKMEKKFTDILAIETMLTIAVKVPLIFCKTTKFTTSELRHMTLGWFSSSIIPFNP